jgi:hypothetical protein
MNQRLAVIWGLVTAGIATVVGLIAYHAGQTSQIATTTTGDGSLVYPATGADSASSPSLGFSGSC